MKTQFPITVSILGSYGPYHIPTGTRCDPAHNIPLDEKGNKKYWVRNWRGMTKQEKANKNCTGILLSREEIICGMASEKK